MSAQLSVIMSHNDTLSHTFTFTFALNDRICSPTHHASSEASLHTHAHTHGYGHSHLSTHIHMLTHPLLTSHTLLTCYYTRHTQTWSNAQEKSRGFRFRGLSGQCTPLSDFLCINATARPQEHLVRPAGRYDGAQTDNCFPACNV